MPTESSAARDKILAAATELFYRDGFRAVGIDTIIAESGVAKMTLYRHFPSKDDLIVAYLEASNRKFWDWFEGALGRGDARRQLVALFTGVSRLAASAKCLGCTFQHAAADFPEPKHPVHRVAMEHKQEVLARLTTLAQRAGARNPAALSRQLLLVMDGAFVAARMFGASGAASQTAEAARTLINAHIKK